MRNPLERIHPITLMRYISFLKKEIINHMIPQEDKEAKYDLEERNSKVGG
jgi:hypothetical protein